MYAYVCIVNSINHIYLQFRIPKLFDEKVQYLETFNNVF